jgi:DNA topoisomerase-2
MDLDDDVEETRPKPAAKRGPKPKQKIENESDDDFLEIAKSEASKPATSRARKPAKYTAPSDSDSDNGDDLLGDVGQMVKGIGGDSNAESRQFFSEKSRPGSSASLKPTTKASKSEDLNDDETDYSKLIPQNSPRRSLLVKSKDVTTIPDDEDEADEPAKPASKAKAAPKSKAASAAPKASGRAKKDAAPAKPAAKSASSGLSAAAKAYASKQAKTAAAKKNIVDDFSEDDIDAMANDILDSPAGKIDADDDDDEPAPRRAAASRPARRTATTKKSYAVAAESDDDDDASADDFDDDESD